MDKRPVDSLWTKVVAGDDCICQTCGHTREFSNAWMRELVEAHFTKRSMGGIYLADISRFKCSMCGARDAWLYAAAPKCIRELRYPVEAKKYDDWEWGPGDGYVEGGDHAWDGYWTEGYACYEDSMTASLLTQRHTK